MLKVLKNEFIKMLSGKKFYVMSAILIGCIVLMLAYRDSTTNAQNFVFEILAGTVMKPILPAFMIIVIAEVITEDYIHGTMKFSLMTPIKRIDLIIGKLLFIDLYAVIFLALSFVTSYIVCAITFGSAIKIEFIKTLLFNIGCYSCIALPLLSFCMFISFLALFINNSGEFIGIGLGIQFMTIIIEHGMKNSIYFLAGGGMYIYDFVRASGELNNICILLVLLCACAYITVFTFFSVIAIKKKDLLL